MFGDSRVRRGTLLIAAAVGLLVGLCLWFARGLPDFRENLLLNMAPELVTTLVTLLVIQPVLTRLEEERVREHLRLDYPSFCDKVAQTGDIVCVLDTFSYLLSGATAMRFAEAARSAIRRGATVRILLLDPDSLAARQRSHELSADVRREVMRNLRELRHLEARLPQDQRERLQVRVYAAAPSIQLYRCGERMMVSFYPVDRLSGEGQQLEVRVTTPLGSFVSERFAELWSRSRTVNEVLTRQVQFVDPNGGEAGEVMWLEYIDDDGACFFSDSRLVLELARHRDRPVSVRLDGDAGQEHELALIADDEGDLLARLRAGFTEKYGVDAEVFVRLESGPRAMIETTSAATDE
ncbi:hypothetical protein DN069_20685 [Streptacidiphilus pinicola]|uniref:Uncharacterized protein n=1 Tax=Streptacidiphilus pinicola TaxID=2219663 RepID=A0A2X0J0J1_9ACTN|nr:hypothetical protein [Streptacidiphilus pinicola]RAG83716.1 hypothetical protein DN069_20685 [Streptacidiphilus pinicola]